MEHDARRRSEWLTSLALTSDLVVLGSAAEIDVTDARIVLRTPSIPALRLGNAVLFPRSPERADVTGWRDILRTEVGLPPAVECRIAWQGGRPSDETYEAFRALGLVRYDSLSMVASKIRGPAPASGVTVRECADARDWADLLRFQNLSVGPGGSGRQFLAQRLDLYRHRAAIGEAAWFAAYRDGGVVGCCGVVLGERFGRLQGMETAIAHRRFGVGRALVLAAGGWALDRARQVVAVADPDYHAARLFESVGFRPNDLACGLVPAATVPPAG
ncbi:MAG TPA: GNAT family N-acetyltransferase [Pilimelia sp.]|nr:GNAT family N-acetyltransferase [Pilimelia sp.]